MYKSKLYVWPFKDSRKYSTPSEQLINPMSPPPPDETYNQCCLTHRVRFAAWIHIRNMSRYYLFIVWGFESVCGYLFGSSAVVKVRGAQGQGYSPPPPDEYTYNHIHTGCLYHPPPCERRRRGKNENSPKVRKKWKSECQISVLLHGIWDPNLRCYN